MLEGGDAIRIGGEPGVDCGQLLSRPAAGRLRTKRSAPGELDLASGDV